MTEKQGTTDGSVCQHDYLQRVLGAYRQTPGTTGQVRPADRRLAAQLYQRGVPLRVVENALVLAAARRILRPNTSPPLATVRSFSYFLPVIEEVSASNVSQDYYQHLRHRLRGFLSA